ncbi:35872_t:CDS:2, partial [Gigaspora margarita]
MMEQISPKIRVGAKVSVLGPVVGKNIARSLWLLATIKQVALGNNHWVISLDLQPETQIDISAGHMNGSEGSEGSEMDISSNSDSDSGQNEGREAIDISNVNRELWNDEIVTIDPCQVQFFERFLPVDFIISVVILATNKYVKEEFIRFIGILTIITYVKCADINDYWLNKQETAGVSLSFDPFYFAWQFHNTFNDNLVNAVLPGSYLCIDESMCQWIGKIDKDQFDTKTRSCRTIKYATRKKFSDQYPPTVAFVLRLTEPWFRSGRTIIDNSWFGSIDTCISLYNYSLYSILQIKKHHYWPKKISYNITSALEDKYSLFVSQTCSASNIDLTLCSICNRKDIALLASCSMTILRSEIR